MWQVPITWVVKAAVSLVQAADSRLPVSSQQGLSSGGKARLQEAASVVVCQAPRGFRRHPCTMCWVSSALPSGRAISRGFLREPEAGNPHIRFDERDVETE